MQIHGAKKQKGGGQKPNIAKDTTASTNYFQGLYGLSEGEVFGLVDGGKSIKLDGTPLINDNGQPNFTGVSWDFRSGTIDQPHIAGFSSVENEQNVNVELRHDRPFTRAISNTQLSALVVRLGWSALREQKDNGDIIGYKIEYAIDVQTDGGAWATVLNTVINDKASQGYQRSHRIDLPKARRGWTVRVRRITPNRDSELIGDTMSVVAVTEVIDAKLRYPCTALLALKYDAETFGNIAKLSVRMRGMIIQVPTNYDPITRRYTGLWDGTFKLAYSDNPAWVFYDICTAKRYGLGERLTGKVDKWALYQLGQYCDELVDDGQGGKEPRFRVNVYLQKADDAYRVLQSLASVFRALSYWDGTQIIVDADTPKEAVYTFSNANVVGGAFVYTGTQARNRHTITKVAYDDPDNEFKTDYVFVRDDYAIAKYGINMLEINAFGCTSRGQAHRAGVWALQSEQLETETVTFSTGLDGFIPKVGDVINVLDNARAGRHQAGRIVKITGVGGRNYTLDRNAGKVGDTFILHDKTAKITKVAGNTITTDKQMGGQVGQVWAIQSDELAPRQYRVMMIGQNDDATFSFSALQYEPQKFSAADLGIKITPRPVSVIKPSVPDAPNSVTLTAHTRTHQGQAVTTLNINWAQVTGAVAYIVEWRKDDNAWQAMPKIASQSVDIDGVYAGNYQARVRAVDAFDNESLATSSVLTTIAGKTGKPPRLARLVVKGLLFGMALDWVFNKGSDDTNFTEIQVSPDGRSNIATLGTFAYPTNKHEITGLQGNLTQFYRARIVDKLGNTSDWTDWVSGTTSADADKVLNLISGQISQSHLDQTLRTPIAKIGTLESAVNAVNSQLPQLNQQLANAARELGTERNRITAAIRDIGTLQTANNAKTQEIANLKQTVDGHASSIRELGVITGDLSQKYTQLKTASDTANSEIVAIKQTQNGQATSIERMGAKFDNLSVGGRNLLLDSNKTLTARNKSSNWNYTGYQLSQALVVGQTYTFSAEVDFTEGASDKVSVLSYKNNNLTEPDSNIQTVPVINGKITGSFVATVPNDGRLLFYAGESGRTYGKVVEVKNAKLERGTVATDWTPAPEDVDGKIQETAQAKIDEYKTSRVEPDRAVAQRIGNLETELNKGGTGIKARLATSEKAISDNERALSQRISLLDSSINSPDGGLSSRVASAERAITAANQTIAEKHEQLTARFDSFEIGGRNLLKNSSPNIANTNYGHRFELTQAPNVGDEVMVTLWGDMGADRTGIGVYNTQGYTELFKLVKIADGVYQGKGQWGKPIDRGQELTPNDTHLNVYFYPRTATSTNRIDKIKLERGTVATDWTPAPEDVNVDLSPYATNASLNEFKQAQVSKDDATAQKLSQLESGLGGKANATALDNLTTKVNQVDGKITAEAQKISQLQTTVGSQTASIRNVEQSVNGVRAIKAVTVDNNGFISGYGLMSELQNGRVTSRFGINADQIYFGETTSAKKPFVFATRPTIIDGVSYPVGAWFNSAHIARASITMLHIADSIQSDNYVAGRQGWRLFKDGRFELNNTFGDGSSLELNSKGLIVWYNKAQGKKAVELGILT